MYKTFQVSKQPNKNPYLDERLYLLGKACLALNSLREHPGPTSEIELNNLLEKLVNIIHDELGYPNCQIFLVDPTGTELVFKYCTGYLATEHRHQSLQKWRPSLVAGNTVGLVGWVGTHHQALNVPNVLDDQRYYNTFPDNQTRAELTVPLLYKDTLLGVLDIQHTELDAFDDRDLEIVTYFAAQASFLIHAARPVWGRPSDLNLLSDAGSGVNSALSQEEISRICLRSLLVALNAASGEIISQHPTSRRIETLASLQMPFKVANKTDRQNSRIIKQVLETREPAFIEDIEHYTERPSIVRRLQNTPIRAFACLPLYVQQEMVGLLFINFNELHSFSDYEKLMLNILAEQTAAALLNARVSQREQTARRFVESLARSSRLVSSQMEAEDVFQTIISEVTQVLGTPMCSISLIGEDGIHFDQVAMVGAKHGNNHVNLQVGRGFIGTVATTGRLWKEYDIARIAEFTNNPIRILEGWHGSIALPIHTGGPEGKVIGVLCTHDTVAREFNSDEIAYLEGLTDQAAISVANARFVAALKRERDMYQALLENANDPIFLLDPTTNRIIDANQQATLSTGYNFEELLGEPVTKLYPPAERSKIQAIFSKAGVEATVAQNIEVQRKDGTHFPASYSTRLVQVGEERIVIQIIRDMSERYTLEQQLARNEQLRVLGQLASGVAHDFNNLLTGILGVSELLLNNGMSPDEEQRLLKMVRQSALDGAQMVRRVQLLGPGHRNEMENLALNDLVQDVVELTRPRWRGENRPAQLGVQLQLELGQIGPIAGNPSELREVLTNLVLNAVDSMPIGGQLTIRTLNQPGEIWLTVEDTGIGMSEETKRHLFEPFYTTKARDGHGLGLSVSNSIIARHNGTIEAHSEIGQGSCFIIKLPLAQATVPAVLPTKTQAVEALRILVVDDDPNLLYILTRFLETDQHKVTSTTSGQEAVQMFSHQPNAYDLVFSDLSLHDLSGWAVTHHIKNLRPNVPVVLITGWGADLDPQMLRSAGVNQVVNKPYRFDDIQNTLRELFPISQ